MHYLFTTKPPGHSQVTQIVYVTLVAITGTFTVLSLEILVASDFDKVDRAAIYNLQHYHM